MSNIYDRFLMIISLNFKMQNSQDHIIHIYGFDEKSGTNENQLILNLQSALKPLVDNMPDIKIRGRPSRYWTYISVTAQQAQKLQMLKKISVGGSEASIGRYYHDHQIFINKLDKKISSEKLQGYFSKYGKVIDVVTTVPDGKPEADYLHCYIKVENEDIANRIILQKNHKIDEIEVKLVRTFMLDEDNDTDKKLFLLIDGDIPLPEVFEQKAISYFSSHGTLRERPKLESISPNKSKIIVTFTNQKQAKAVLTEFPQSEFVKQASEIKISMKLRNFLTKENKIFVKGLKQTTEAAILQAFDVFGTVSDISLNKNKTSPGMTAIIGFKNQFGYKNALANYLDQKRISHLFMGRPNINVYLAPEDKKSFNKHKYQSRNYDKPTFPVLPPQPMMPRGMNSMNPSMNMNPPMNMNQQMPINPPPQIGFNQPPMYMPPQQWVPRGNPQPPQNYPPK